jgi:hypothetical protein
MKVKPVEREVAGEAIWKLAATFQVEVDKADERAHEKKKKKRARLLD